MSVIAAGVALLLSARREAPGAADVARELARLADGAEVRFNGGNPAHAALAWGLLAAGLAVAAMLAGHVLAGVTGLLAGLLSVFLLWHALRWQPSARAWSRVRWALLEGQVDLAREALADWGARVDGSAGMPDAITQAPGEDGEALTAMQIADAAISRAAADALRTVYSPLFWFALLPGGAGAVLVRVADAVAVRWSEAPEPAVRETVGRWALLAREGLEVLPARLVAALIAVCGDTGATAEAWRATPAAPGRERIAGSADLVAACALAAIGTATESVGEACAHAVARLDAAARLQRRVLVGALLLMLLPALVS